MANIINTQIQIESDNPKVFQFLLKWFEGVTYSEYTDTMFIFNKLYGEGKYDRTDYVDKIGTKWCYPTDWDLTEDSDYGSINFESAWYPPIEAFEELTKQLHQIDNEVMMSYEWEDENIWNTHGGGAGYKGNFEHLDGCMDEDSFGEEPDWEDETYDEWSENVRDSLYESKSTLMNTAKDTVTSTHLTNS